jgi:hypothetical protein
MCSGQKMTIWKSLRLPGSATGTDTNLWSNLLADNSRNSRVVNLTFQNLLTKVSRQRGLFSFLSWRTRSRTPVWKRHVVRTKWLDVHHGIRRLLAERFKDRAIGGPFIQEHKKPKANKAVTDVEYSFDFNHLNYFHCLLKEQQWSPSNTPWLLQEPWNVIRGMTKNDSSNWNRKSHFPSSAGHRKP